ncbi:transcription elongation regulator [Kappamyces sp. JEL0829]|nr:transcription elongation regulator [Kappamyces sp. JEL0829]
MNPLGWVAMQTVDGRAYWFNTITNESTWTRPEELRPPPPPPRVEAEVVVEMYAVVQPNPTRKLIPDTDWAICLTNKDHEFFHHLQDQDVVPSWDIPDEILEIVGGLLQEAVADDGEVPAEDVPEDEPVDTTPEVAEVESTGTDLDRDAPSDAAEPTKRSFEGDDEAPKRVKLDIAPTKSTEQLKSDFLSLLHENSVSPFCSWDLEDAKYAADTRVQDTTLKDRKAWFGEWAADRSREQIAASKAKLADGKAAFLALLEEQVTNKMVRYDDFSRRFKRDVRFLRFENAKEKEELFRTHVQKLKDEEKIRARKAFSDLLDRCDWINSQTTWIEAQLKLETSAEFKAVKNAQERENLFRLQLRKFS